MPLLGAAVLAAAAASGPGGRALALTPETPAGEAVGLAGPIQAIAGGPARIAMLEVAPLLGRDLAPPGSPAGAEPAAFTPGRIVSGLTWRSGASCADAAFAQWRGRQLDETDFGANHPTWDAWLANLRAPAFKASVALTPQPVVALAMFPKSVPKQYADCAGGKFDGYMRQVGAILKAQGAVSNGRHAILRLGWEANIGSGSHPWGVDTTADAAGYVACYRRWVGVLRPILPGIMFEWTNAKVSHLPGSPYLTYPGDGYADLWGLHYYDKLGQFHTEALWDAYYGSTYKGGPQGLGSWLQAASAAGKKLAVPEWGVRQDPGTSSPFTDDPFYIRKMFQTFSTHASEIAYENYFNCSDRHRLFPDSPYPKAAAEYQKLWSAGP